MKITRLLGAKVLVEPIEEPAWAEAGLVLPEIARATPRKGTIVLVGTGDKDKYGKPKPMGFSVGDKVLFDRGSGQEIEQEDENGKVVKYLLIKDGEIAAKVKEG